MILSANKILEADMAKKQFKAESKKLLDLMIHSIYTNKEIFLRELISNSSDALDKLYYKSLSSGELGIKRNDFYIRITPDKELRTLTIRDNGIGMSKEELEKDLGTIAKSGFKKESYKTSEILQRYQYFMRAAVRYCKISGSHLWSWSSEFIVFLYPIDI